MDGDGQHPPSSSRRPGNQRRAGHRRRGVEQSPRPLRRDAPRGAARQGGDRRSGGAAGERRAARRDARRRAGAGAGRRPRLASARQVRRRGRRRPLVARGDTVLRPRLAPRPRGRPRGGHRRLGGRPSRGRRPRAHDHRHRRALRPGAALAGETPVITPASVGTGNFDSGELAKFSALAHHWSGYAGSTMFSALHKLNPLRLGWIEAAVGGLAGKRVVDVGCGGGILSEAMAGRGAAVLGIDLADKPLGVARLHKLESGAAVDYRLVAAEALAAEAPDGFDVVTCMEMLEHVPDPASTIII